MKRRRSTARSIVELVVIVAVALGLALGVQAFLIKPYQIPSPSMVPTLEVGQRVLVNRLGTHFGDPSVGDILVFHPPSGAADGQCGVEPRAGQACTEPTKGEASDTYIKRVVGGPGDTLSIVNGHVIRNGQREADGYTAPCGPDGSECTLATPFKVPAGHWFMMGDNRGDSEDSRYWGPIPTSSIIGEAFATYWPLDRIGPL